MKLILKENTDLFQTIFGYFSMKLYFLSKFLSSLKCVNKTPVFKKASRNLK